MDAPDRPASGGGEIELKFAVGPEDLPFLRRLPLIAGTAPSRQSLTSIYFDTPDLGLRRRALALRIRKEGRRYVQTLKRGNGDAAGYFARPEWQMPVRRTTPDLSSEELRRELGDLAAEPLRPVFTSRIRRTTRLLHPSPDTAIELAFDQGSIASPAGTEVPVCEVELELKEGDPQALFDLARTLNAVRPLRLETRSKSARGYALLDGAGPEEAAGTERYGQLDLTRETPVETALAVMIRRSLTHLLNNDQASRQGDPEGVHQMRVALRRLRVALSLFKDLIPDAQRVWATTEIKWLAGVLGAARNWDVFGGLVEPVAKAFDAEADVAALAARIAAEKQSAYAALRGELQSSRYAAIPLELVGWIETRAWRRQAVSETSIQLLAPVGELADELLEKRYRKVRKLAKRFAELTPDERHQLRIALKKLRYAADAFGRIYEAKAVTRYGKHLSALQDELGLLNDIATIDRLARELPARPEDKGDVGRGAAIVEGWSAHIAADRVKKLGRRLALFLKAAPFWQRPRKRDQSTGARSLGTT
jgi:triphosphatase